MQYCSLPTKEEVVAMDTQTSPEPLRMLGISGGTPGGSVEILLRRALDAGARAGLEPRMLRLADLDIPFHATGDPTRDGADSERFWEALMEADALVIAVPIYARSAPGTLRLLADRLLGPNADAAFVTELLALRAAGREPSVPFRVDERVLRPRVAGFIACGGSLPDRWKTLALPELHGFTFPMHIAVVDQVQFAGAGTPASIVLDPEALERAATLGSRVASQSGRPFEAAEYLGPPGLCPMCHLDVIELRSGGTIECATCGAAGRLELGPGGPAARFDAAGCTQSVISMDEKRAHFFEVQETAARQAERAQEIRERAAAELAR
jgi:multimeric flavodoxin WrbA